MSSPKPVFLDLHHFADIGKKVSGSIQLTDLQRLAQMLEGEGSAEFELNFARDKNKRVQINGWIKSELMLQCQRCLEPVVFKAERSIRLVVVEGLDEAEMLSAAVDPLLIEEDSRIGLHDLLEDELLLALPQVPRHEDGECKPVAQQVAAAVEPELADEERADSANRFAELAELKSKKP
jgi:uncharacterized protein